MIWPRFTLRALFLFLLGFAVIFAASTIRYRQLAAYAQTYRDVQSTFLADIKFQNEYMEFPIDSEDAPFAPYWKRFFLGEYCDCHEVVLYVNPPLRPDNYEPLDDTNLVNAICRLPRLDVIEIPERSDGLASHEGLAQITRSFPNCRIDR